jgi:glycerophosphoryl diester phosphodiesterase
MARMDWQSFYAERGERTRPLLIAHRGVPGALPENSLAAFALALEQGADVLETDLHITQDGEIVLFHDHSLTRMTDGSGPLFAESLRDLKQLRLRSPQGTWTSERVPTLVELLEMTQGNVPLLLELKDVRFFQPRHAEHLVRLLTEYGALAKTAIISFNAALVAAVRRVAPSIPTGVVTLTHLFPPRHGELVGPVWPLLYANPLFVRMAHSRGQLVAPLDTTPERRMGYYLRLGVDAVLADNPAAALAAMALHGRPVHKGAPAA